MCVAGILAYIADKLKTIDVGHIDISDDQIDLFSRKKPQSLESACCLDNLIITARFDRRYQERAHRCGVFSDKNSLHAASGRLLCNLWVNSAFSIATPAWERKISSESV